MVQIKKEFIIIITFFIIGVTLYLLIPLESFQLNKTQPENKVTESPTRYSPKQTENPVKEEQPTTTPTATSKRIEKKTNGPVYYLKEVEGLNNDGLRSEFAYSFYITKDNYLCAALITANNIRKWSTNDIVVHLIEYQYNEVIMKNFMDIPNVYFRFVKNVLPKNGNMGSTWEQTWNKFYVFKLIDYKRVVHLDADTYLLKSLDHLFELPDATLALPRAYWLGQPFATSLLMVIKPSYKLYDDIISYGNKHNSGNSWDMDIINDMFKNSPDFIMLPGIYGLLHGEFSTRERHWLGDDYFATWEKAPLFHWSTWKPWNEHENSANVISYGDLYKKTWTLWNDGLFGSAEYKFK
ncbi:hypothetical protein DICPUDRAFT_154205 [Dictyostelium purpureum]|uniref:Glycosyltransferase family 8 protein n=1 Tax=Dictyostelium purpureum TaxID=5786 RepID=F0ZQR1_DICPU|nr:uncharacterized protein DICPUDRAFT_154205 [Dictyostelium purpureum]EGC33711.1 hypothetical protein DICPUDRAFT_154205 [Dictyostelium purpureum]|eukprot:XP_003289750.1 hypothetical protein DICPUDRAFT_154205 [Dictyostelium purpureum]